MARYGHPWPPLACGSSLALPSPPHDALARQPAPSMAPCSGLATANCADGSLRPSMASARVRLVAGASLAAAPCPCAPAGAIHGAVFGARYGHPWPWLGRAASRCGFRGPKERSLDNLSLPVMVPPATTRVLVSGGACIANLRARKASETNAIQPIRAPRRARDGPGARRRGEHHGCG